MDSFSHSSEDVLNDLDPLSRALLDLSVQRGMDDAEIAQVLGTDEDSVFEVRVGLLRSLADRVAPEQADAELPELEAAVAERLYPAETPGEAEIVEDDEAAEAIAAEDDTVVEADDLGDEVDEAELEETPTEAEPDDDAAAPAPAGATGPRRESRRRSWLPIVLPILLLLAVIAFIIAAGVGSDSDSELSDVNEPATQPKQPTTTDTTPKPDANQPEEATGLTGLGSSQAKGTATLEGDKLTLTLKNLPPANGGTYTVWLYDNVIDAQELKTVKNGKATVMLPEDADKYESLDVSLEPKDGNPNHSGQSVLRVPLKKLEQAAG